MNETEGIVVRIEGEFAWVEAAGPAAACGACAQKAGCPTAQGSGALLDGIRKGGGQNRLLCLPNTIHARPGDAVVIQSAAGLVLRAVWFAYGVPLLLGIAGALLASALTGSEAFAVGGLVLGLAGGIFVMRWRRLDAGRAEPIFSIRFKHPSHFIIRGPESC